MAGEVTLTGLQGAAPAAAPQVIAQAQGAGRKRVVNQLPSKVVVCAEGERRFVLSPLEERSLTETDWQSFERSLLELEDRRVVALGTDPMSQPKDDVFWIIFGLGIWIVPAYVVAGIFFSSLLYWLVGLFAAGLVAFSCWRGRRSKLQKLFWPLLVVLAVGIAAPAAAVYFGGDVNSTVDRLRASGGDELVYLTLIGRILQAVLIAIAALLPALLYFLFDRMKVETLRGNFVSDIFRFDPTVATLSDVRARYGPLMDEIYGPDGSSESSAGTSSEAGGRSLPGRRAPVWVATVVITVGWILCLLNPDVGALSDAEGIVSLFEPQRSPVVFGFLGAYVFALQSLLRSYLRADLRPKSYTHITVRIFVAVIFAWLLELLFLADPTSTTSEEPLLVAAFVVGILPETLLVRLQETARRIVGGANRQRLPQLYESYPLTDLEGIDIYDRARLLEEGVGNIEGLAHHNLPELMMQTRIPVGRLVHWTDQAILHLHVATEVDASNREDEKCDDPDARLPILHAHGIHTATDLRNAYNAAKARTDPEALEAFLSLLVSTQSAKGGQIFRLQGILDAIEDEEWMPNLEHWHDQDRCIPRTLELKGGELVVGRDPARPAAG